MKRGTLRAGQVYVLSYGDASDVFLLLERFLVEDIDARWDVLRLSDGKTRTVSEEWLLSRDSTRVS